MRGSSSTPATALQGVLPRSLRARVEERVLLETPVGIGDHPLYPDVRVVEYMEKRGLETRGEAGVAVAEPLLVAIEVDAPTETLIEIVDSESGNRVVTVIEFLSPSNKSPGPNREQYIRKQREICASSANLVEIDLNRFGTHALAFPLTELRARQAALAYMGCVRRATRRGIAEVYPMPLWKQLPDIKIPLRPGDTDVTLNVQAIVVE